MDIETRLLDLLVEWNEAVLAGKAVSIEGLAPNDPDLQRRLREALSRQESKRAGTETTSTGLYVPTEDGQQPALNFPGFRITGEIGRGGMGAVYEADDILLGRKVAIKTIRPELAARDEAKARFLQEARAAASIRSDHVVTIHRVDEAGGVPFIAMEFLKGQPLNLWMKEHRAGPSHIRRIGQEIALGLVAAHESGRIHRDIKPANIWLEAPNGRVKILDFGLARTIEADFRLTSSGVIIGTPAYMAPEQASNGEVDHRSDLFSLGAVLYQLASGRRPFQGRDVFEVLESLATKVPPPVASLNAEIGPDLAALIDRLLAKDPAARPQSSREVAMELRRIHRSRPEKPKAEPAELPPRTDIELDAAVLPAPPIPAKVPAKLWPRVVTLAAAALIVFVCAAVLLKMLLAKPKSRPGAGGAIRSLHLAAGLPAGGADPESVRCQTVGIGSRPDPPVNRRLTIDAQPKSFAA